MDLHVTHKEVPEKLSIKTNGMTLPANDLRDPFHLTLIPTSQSPWVWRKKTDSSVLITESLDRNICNCYKMKMNGFMGIGRINVGFITLNLKLMVLVV